MRFVALTFGISPSGREIIENIGANVFNQSIEIVDLKTTDPQLFATDWLLCFGLRAKKEIPPENHVCYLPSLKNLEPGNDKQREEAYKSLVDFFEAAKSIKTITKDSLPNIPCSQVEAIEERLRQKGENSWIGKTKDGKSIELLLQPGDSKAEISLTFSELYAIKTAMETLGIEEVEIT